jgi:hypothetical protein
MDTIRIVRRLESESLTLPELKPLVGKVVVITVCEQSPQGGGPSPYDAFFQLAGKDAVDTQAYQKLRAASMI